MNSTAHRSEPVDFLQVATKHKLLTVAASQEIAKEAADRGVLPAQLAVEKGLLDAVDKDVVEMLQRPHDAVPGYEIVDVLGRGGMGVVFRARQRNLDRLVALKTILFSQAAQPGALARFEQEAISIGRLRHPNIVTAYDFGRHGGRLFFAMEILEGHDLGQLLRQRGPLDEATAWGVARQTAAGLSHAAQAGIVHRDIKPANLFLVASPVGFSLPAGLPMVKITDFGLALLAHDAFVSDRITAAGSTLGTPQYMAPEQFGGSDVDCRADIYSLGATVYQMLTGRPPFPGKSLVEIVGQKLRGELPAISTLSPDVSAASTQLVTDMMACSADARPADYAAVLARIDALPAPKARPSRTFQASDAGISHDQATDEVSLAATVGVLPSAAAADAEAAESAPREKKGPRIHVGRVALLAAIAAVLISAWAWIFHDRVSSDPVVDPPYFPSDWVEPLFDGVSIGGWAVRRGGWAPGLDSEGGIVLEGSGTIARPLPQKDGAALTHYQLTLGVNLHEAEAVEVHFGVPASAGADQAHLVIRMTRDEAALGRRSGRDRDFESTSAPIDLPPEDGGATEHYHALRVERQSKQWDAYCDERKVGAVPIADRSELAEFWLVTEGGEARFENLEVRELLPIDVQPNRFAPR